ncbi:FtsX-like permease family protein [Antarcticibacterium sp. 1MA-6-2]|uniref:ABC transporter permease n=1 Tax=Antarcticibacterium sp. 1MA-6-2 TaxID=2908210 RepID=UPI001F1AFC81|nr:FtsX-like permease family protein [Antarcticibacterium sp. 1MA-6-2]UJH91012.1 FtsX-like permease family protein [Antarcticibacterium sp. 1MA-6-2]
MLQGKKQTALTTPFTAVISRSTAQKYFGEEDPLGKTIKIFDEGYSVEITGVMEDIPLNSHIQADIVLSMVTFSQNLYQGVDEQWGNYSPSTYILVAPNTNPKQLEAKFPAFLEKKAGNEMKESQMFVSLFLEPFEEVYLHSSRGGSVQGSINNVYIFGMVVVFILLIACINFINLTTARSVERAKEVGIRKVVGAQKRHLGSQFIGESIVICFIAAVFTVGFVSLLLPYFNQMAGKTVAENIFSEPFYLLMLFVVAIILGLISGIYPALVLSSFK